MPFIQENRFIGIDTPLGPEALLLTELTGTEGLSTLFSFELGMVSEDANLAFENIIGKSVTTSIVLADGENRCFNGIVSRFSHGKGGEGETGADPHFSYYRATMVPWLWLLTRTTDLRIFQNLSVPDIVEKIFTEKGHSDYKLNLKGTYNKRVYCVQYRETDFNFISRLLEEEGIYYYFKHEENKHTLILADSPDGHEPCPKQETARFGFTAGGFVEEDVITNLEKMQEIRPGKYSLSDFNFETPLTDLEVNVPSRVTLGPGEREIYDYPGLYGKKSEGDRFANIRIQEEEAKITTIIGSSVCRAFTSGYRFVLKDYFRNDMTDKPYVLTSIDHGASQALTSRGETSQGEKPQFVYVNHFTCIPFDVPYRPALRTEKPTVKGTQTAIVVGPKGEEIYTDEHGRVKVQFHWDREGKMDDKSSCWIRVSHAWAGPMWGAIYTPRIGQEVIVDFLEGDPDRPIIVGRVYHGNNKPPYTLPDEKTKSTLKSDSSLGGDGFNEMRFEDKKGKEQIFVHAERNQDIRVKNDQFEWIGRDTHLIVKRDQLELVEGDKHQHVKLDRNEKVDGAVSVKIGTDRQEKVGTKYAMDAGQEIHLKSGMKVVIEGGMQVTMKVGGNFVDISPAGVTIMGTLVNINSGGAAGAGSGSSPDTPKDPEEADTAKPGEKVKLRTPTVRTAPAAPGGAAAAQKATLKAAAKAGTPFCDT